jgi:biotin carboxylase
VLKPRSLSGSRGVIRADTRDGAAAAAVRVRAISAEVTGDAHDDILLERFVPGAEVAVEALAHRGQITALAVFDKPDPLEGPYFAETIYVTPSRLPEATQAAVVSLVGRGCRAIGLTDGAVHAEVRLGDDGPRLIDVAARSIGGHCARVLRFSAGAALEELVLRHALGDSLDGRLEREGAAAGVLMLPVPRAGVLRAVHGIDDARAVPGVTDVEVTIAAGGAVRPLPEGDRYLGFVFARGDDPASVEAALRGAQRRLDVDIA